MSYSSWRSGKDIPTKRRLDYIIDDCDGMDTGRLYGAFRHLSPLNKYLDKSLSDDDKDKIFAREECVTVPKLEWVNEWMAQHGKLPLFTDVHDWRAIAADYDYFWNLRTEEQFAQEEEAAKAGTSGRLPIEKKMKL